MLEIDNKTIYSYKKFSYNGTLLDHFIGGLVAKQKIKDRENKSLMIILIVLAGIIFIFSVYKGIAYCTTKRKIELEEDEMDEIPTVEEETATYK